MIINGANLVEQTRKKEIKLTANAFYPGCYGQADELNKIIFKWDVFKYDDDGRPVELQTHLPNESPDPSIFRLSPYSLDVGETYDILLTVTRDDNEAASTKMAGEARISVNVLRSDVQAVISGSVDQMVRNGEVLIIDASNSFDEDYANVYGNDAGLTFSWECVQKSPSLGATCDSLIDFIFNSQTLSSHVESTLKITPKQNDKAQLMITLTVEHKATGRADAKEILVTTDSGDVPLLAGYGGLIKMDTRKSISVGAHITIDKAASA